MLEIKRLIINVAQRYVFEQNTPQTRQKFVKDVSPILALIQLQSGIEKFSVTMDESNNTTEDVEANKLNGRIVVVPTRTTEFISVDFIITNSGVSFS
jgi:phage tail sheath protein FI